jgi:hypothetical protein
MFTSLLANLQTLISTRFLVASFFPTMAFGFANALMLFCLNAPFHEYVVANGDLGVGLASLTVAAALVGLAFLAYAEGALLPTIQSVMEGNWPPRIASLFGRSQMNRYDQLQQEMKRTSLLYRSFSTMADSRRIRKSWREKLQDARDRGADAGNGYVLGAASAKAVLDLDALSRERRHLTDHEIGEAVDAFCTDLGQNDIGLPGPQDDHALEAVYHLLSVIIDGAEKVASRYEEEGKRLRPQLTDARIAGNLQRTNDYARDDTSVKLVGELADLRRAAQPITADQVRAAIGALVPHLRANNADVGAGALEDVRQLLWDLIDYAEQYATSRFRSLRITQQFEYGTFPLAPTRMGNVARTVQNYTVQRYDLNFEILWSRLQIFAQKDKDFGPTLQAAKTQLDFLISCSAWTFVWSLVWAVWLCLSQGPAPLFLGVALLGPLLSYVWYRAAVAQYRTVADLLRSSVDLFRFDLLAALRYPQPGSVQEETELWRTVDALHARYELYDLRYVPPKSA